MRSFGGHKTIRRGLRPRQQHEFYPQNQYQSKGLEIQHHAEGEAIIQLERGQTHLENQLRAQKGTVVIGGNEIAATVQTRYLTY